MSAKSDALEARRAELVARAAADRQVIVRQLAPLRRLDSGLAELAAWRHRLPGLAVGAGIGVSALLLALPRGRTPLLRGGLALVHLAGSVRKLFSRSRSDRTTDELTASPEREPGAP